MAKIKSSPTKIRVLARGSVPPFQLVSGVGGSNLPFAFGHAFREGDIPAGKVAIGIGCTDWQCTPLTHWPDGSLKHGLIAGRITLPANSPTPISLSPGTAASGTALTQADLKAALPSVTVKVGSHVTNLNDLVNASAPHRTVCTGPVMSNWIYRQAVTGSAHLVVWVDVRMFKGGAVEIFPWVENGFLTVPNPINSVQNCVVTINGVQKFSQSIDIKHHTRVPLISGVKFSYWTGADPDITPMHDTSYMMAAKVVPNYPHGVTASAYRFSESYTPNFIGNTSAGMGSAGFANHIGVLPSWAATYLAGGGDPRAYRYVIVNGLAAGSWSIHHRNEVNAEVPTYTEFPKISITWSGTPAVPDGAGPVNTDSRESRL